MDRSVVEFWTVPGSGAVNDESSDVVRQEKVICLGLWSHFSWNHCSVLKQTLWPGGTPTPPPQYEKAFGERVDVGTCINTISGSNVRADRPFKRVVLYWQWPKVKSFLDKNKSTWMKIIDFARQFKVILPSFSFSLLGKNCWLYHGVFNFTYYILIIDWCPSVQCCSFTHICKKKKRCVMLVLISIK